MLDTPLVRGERGGLAEVGVLWLDMVKNKDGRTVTGTFLFIINPHVYLVSRLQGQGTECSITHYIH